MSEILFKTIFTRGISYHISISPVLDEKEPLTLFIPWLPQEMGLLSPKNQLYQAKEYRTLAGRVPSRSRSLTDEEEEEGGWEPGREVEEEGLLDVTDFISDPRRETQVSTPTDRQSNQTRTELIRWEKGRFQLGFDKL